MNKRWFGLIVIASFSVMLFLGIISYRRFYDKKLHVIFCDVGQGDGVIIKSPNGRVILFDGGPDDTFATCLSDHLPFWLRTIDLMMVSHPHADHYVGNMLVLEKYQVKAFATEALTSSQQSYQFFLDQLHKKKIPKKTLKKGDTIQIGDVGMKIVGPSHEFLTRTSPEGKIGESKEFGSLVVLLSYDSFSLLLTGDSQAPGVQEAIDRFSIKNISILQTPHHGSGTGLTKEIMNQLRPKAGVVSVGAKNRYGHPASTVLGFYQQDRIPLFRTDTHGTIKIVTNGDGFQVVKSR